MPRSLQPATYCCEMATADFQRFALRRDVTAEAHENLAIRCFLQRIDKSHGDQRVAMNAHERVFVLGFQLLERVVDQVFPFAIGDPGVLLVGLEERNALDRQKLELAAELYADVTASLVEARAAGDAGKAAA